MWRDYSFELGATFVSSLINSIRSFGALDHNDSWSPSQAKTYAMLMRPSHLWDCEYNSICFLDSHLRIILCDSRVEVTCFSKERWYRLLIIYLISKKVAQYSLCEEWFIVIFSSCFLNWGPEWSLERSCVNLLEVFNCCQEAASRISS